MKIIKEAPDLGQINFACPSCATLFTANRGEYQQSLGHMNDLERIDRGLFLNFWSPKAKQTTTNVWYVTMKCPCCQVIARRTVPTGEVAVVSVVNPYSDW